MKLYKTKKVENAVWVSGITNTYEKFEMLKKQDTISSLKDFYFSTQAILNNIDNLLGKEKSRELFIEEYIGDLVGNKYNYFVSNNKKEIRVAKLNEFFGYKVCPLKFEKEMYIETSRGDVLIEDLVEWYIYEYNILL